MKYLNIMFSLIILNLSIFPSHAQDSIRSVQTPSVIVKATAKNGKILLRWVVNDKFAWKYGNEYGYIIERTTVLQDGKPLKDPLKIILTDRAIKPKPIQEWKTFVSINDMAAVAAQAIYGVDFEMGDKTVSNKILKVIQENEELDRRFSFSLFAIDHEFKVAQYAGLGYVDNDVKPNEKYLYKIRSAVPEDILKIKTGGVFISPSEEEELPKPIDFSGYQHNNSFTLVWEYDLLLPFYTSYDLEKSEDGITFKKVNRAPITKLTATKSTGVIYIDSITEFNKKYWYRVIGNSVFNEKSKPSDTIGIFAFEEINTAPVLKDSAIASGREVRLEWTYPKKEESLIKHFDLLRADIATGPYKVVKEAIPPSSRTYSYKNLGSINYFKLKTVSKSGKNTLSFPLMVQPIDSIPPLKPQNLKGSIDNQGVVSLTWTENKDSDLRGYKIFRADRPDQEFTMLNKYSELSTGYIDTVNVHTFNKQVYYKIMALDHRYNESEYSDVLILKRPDNIPPTSPVFDTYLQEGGNVFLKWIKSSSDDIDKEVLYRKKASDMESIWENIYETTSDTTSFYIDDKVMGGNKYLYTLIAIDHSGLESPPSPVLAIDIINTLAEPPVKGLYTTVDRENKWIHLFWRYNAPDVYAFLVYKKKKGQVFSLFRTLKADKRHLIDTDLSPNTTYNYGIKAVFNDGRISKWVEIETVY